MRKALRALLWIVVVGAVVGGPAYYLLVLQSPTPRETYTLDLGQVRALADSVPGDKAKEIRYEHVLTFKFAEAMMMAGDPWRATPVPVYSYQLVFPQQTIIVDTGLPRAMAKPDSMVLDADDAAYARMQAAMDKAAQIVITHEHMDHIGGLATHPHLAQLLPRVKLTAEQLAHPERMKPAQLPAGVMQGYQPLHYATMAAIAPGVVLIKAPGHTPGSQLVYVKRADGRELLFLGDVTWRLRNLDYLRERPLFMTLLIGENRQQVLAEFQALHDLREREPTIALVPGHDGDAIRSLTEAGLLTAGFVP